MNKKVLTITLPEEIPSNHEDTRLMHLVKCNDDEAAFEALFAKYYSRLCELCEVFVNDSDASEDIVQAFLQTFGKKENK